MDYRKMWEQLRAEIDLALEEGRDCGYDDPKSENFDKFYVYERIGRKMDALEAKPEEVYQKYGCPTMLKGEIMSGIFERSNMLRKTFNLPGPTIKKVVFNDPATVVMWSDGTKTVVKCQPGDDYSKETGLALCIAKKYLGNKGNFNEVLKKWIPEEVEEISVYEMRKSLDRFCHGKNCIGCLLDEPVCRCGCGAHFLSKRSDGSYDMSDDEIRKAYAVAFKRK